MRRRSSLSLSHLCGGRLDVGMSSCAGVVWTVAAACLQCQQKHFEARCSLRYVVVLREMPVGAVTPTLG